jgi:hypothetical protein
LNREDRAAVRKAARLLRDDARLTFESCKGTGPWACGDCPLVDGKCSSRRSHDTRLAVAKRLMAMAGKSTA